MPESRFQVMVTDTPYRVTVNELLTFTTDRTSVLIQYRMQDTDVWVTLNDGNPVGEGAHVAKGGLEGHVRANTPSGGTFTGFTRWETSQS